MHLWTRYRLGQEILRTPPPVPVIEMLARAMCVTSEVDGSLSKIPDTLPPTQTKTLKPSFETGPRASEEVAIRDLRSFTQNI